MGTRATVGIGTRNGYTWAEYVTINWDGYYEHVGTILQKNYNSKELVMQLLEGGEIRSLAEDIASTEYYNEGCFACKKAEWPTFNDFNYIFDTKQNKWLVSHWDNGWRELAPIIAGLEGGNE